MLNHVSRLRAPGLCCVLLASCGGETAFSTEPPALPPQGATATSPATAPPSAAAMASELQRVRDATAVYLDVARARADGFAAVTGACVNSGLGTQGISYVNATRMTAALDLEHPAGLVYVPDGDQQRLAGVKYLVPIMVNGTMYMGTAAPPAVPTVRPAVLGHDLYGPVPGETPDQPWHYELLVWVWQGNPDGSFSPWNASVPCA